MGFVTRGRGVSVHRADCANAVSLAEGQGARLIEVEWDQERGADTFVVSIEVKALDRSKLLRDVSASLAEHHVNILACTTQTGTDRISRMRFDFELADLRGANLHAAHFHRAVLRHAKTDDAVVTQSSLDKRQP